jgi:hypothetical protein
LAAKERQCFLNFQLDASGLHRRDSLVWLPRGLRALMEFLANG